MNKPIRHVATTAVARHPKKGACAICSAEAIFEKINRAERHVIRPVEWWARADCGADSTFGHAGSLLLRLLASIDPQLTENAGREHLGVKRVHDVVGMAESS